MARETLEEDGAFFGLIRAKQGAHEFGASGAYQAEQPYDLAGLNSHGYVREAIPAKILDLKQRPHFGRLWPGVTVLHGPPDHVENNLLLIRGR